MDILFRFKSIFFIFFSFFDFFFSFSYRNPRISAGIRVPMGNGEWVPATGMGTGTGGKILNGDGGRGACPRPHGDPLPSLVLIFSDELD